MSQPIWYDSTEVGAPVLNNVAGSLLAVLRACLINGFNEKTVTSITVASEVATAACTGHGFLDTYGKLVEISGWGSQPLDGPKQISNVTTDTFDFAAPGVADGVYTPTGGGTILAYRAPLGWTEPHTGTNVAMFARSAVEATALLLRVDDTGTSLARTRMVETATDVDTFTGPAPTDAQLSGGGIWQKSSTGTNPWFVVGTDRGFWFGSVSNASPLRHVYYWFGDGKPYYSVDPYFCLLTTQPTLAWSSTPNFEPARPAPYTTSPTGTVLVVASRGLAVAATSSELQAVAGPNLSTNTYGSSLGQPVTFENVVVVDTLHVIGDNKVVRGEMPGAAAPMAVQPFTPLSPITSVAGTTYLPVSFNYAGILGQLCFRLSGGWY